MNGEWSIKNFDKIFDSYEELELEEAKIVKLLPQKRDQAVRDEILELSSKGWSNVKIAEKFKVSKGVVSGIVHRAKMNGRKNKGKYD